MKKRSKNGCVSCRKLRIKCDESRPKCEYCQHTNRDCSYIEPVEKAAIKKKSPPAKLPPKYKSRKQLETISSVWSIIKVTEDEKPLPPAPSCEFDRVFDEEESRSFEQFVYNKTLFAPNLQLSMSKFEFRLLEFFHTFCVKRFCIGACPEVKAIWKNSVPSLFLRSKLLRCSVYSYAANKIVPKCDFNQLISDSKGDSLRRSDSFESTMFNPGLTSEQNLVLLHEKTVEYFLEASKITREIVEETLQTNMSYLKSHADELALSSMLIFAFLLLQPDYFIPVVSWDRSEADFLSMAKGLMFTMQQCVPLVMKTEFAGLFINKKIIDDLPDECPFPMIAKLEEDFLVEYPVVHEFTAESLLEREALNRCIRQLSMLFRKLLGSTLPEGKFRWVDLISEDLQELVYAKNFFALHIMYVYATIVLLRKYERASSENMWLSYMRWFKEYNFETFGYWKYTSDERLFWFVHEQNLRFKSPTLIAIFDPDAQGCEEFLVPFAERYKI